MTAYPELVSGPFLITYLRQEPCRALRMGLLCPELPEIDKGTYNASRYRTCDFLIIPSVSSQLGMSGTDWLTRRHFSRPSAPIKSVVRKAMSVSAWPDWCSKPY